jgi:trans-aconitate methyltransferase
MESNWKDVWNARRMEQKSFKHSDEILDALISMDGFDSPLSIVSHINWKDYTLSLAKKMKIEKGESVFEIGCGAGALLYSLFLEGYKVGGIDYSVNMVREAKKYLPRIDISVGEATTCSTDETYDAVISNSVFSYFTNYDYAKAVMEKMFLKARKVISILDIPDFSCKEESERIREERIKNYHQLYRDTMHLYYKKEWFLNFASEKNCEIKIENQNIVNYGNSRFRFNCFLWKD